MARPWHEQDEFWHTHREALFGPRRWAQAETEADLLIALLDLPADARVLDMPCGPGRHALALAQRGMRVTGVDRTQAYLDEAGRRAADAGLAIDLHRADMREFRVAAAFDAAISMYTSLGYFEDRGDDERTLRNVLGSLRPGGALLVEMHGKEILAAGFQPREWHELDGGDVLLEERAVVDHWRAIHNRWILFRDGRRHETELRVRIYGAAELIDLLESAGFGEIGVYGGLAGEPYDEHAERLVAVGRRT